MDKLFLIVGRLEGFSFLALLLLAMPLKYYGGFPLGVRILGPVHGALFLAYVAAALLLSARDDWGIKKLFLAIVASVLPCGTFLFERRFLNNKKFANS